MNPDDAGIIVKCSGGKVKISGATELTDEQWAFVQEYGAPLWMYTAFKNYGIPVSNLFTAYKIDKDICKTFDGTGRFLVGDGTAFIDTKLTLATQIDLTTKFKWTSSGSLQTICGNSTCVK